MKDAEIFDNIFRNALDFLNRALDELDAHPKYALIDFAAAVELVFKARLVLVDSMWIADEPTDATPEKFKQGKLRTVGLELAKKRIESLTDENIDATAFKAFQTVARHRNRVVHFFHPDLDSENPREAVAREIYVAWYYLYRLLTELWGKHFLRYSNLISEFGARLQSLTPFLDAVFDREVKNNPKASNFTKCPVCNYQSLDAATSDRYQSAVCHVCRYIQPSQKAIQQGDEDFVACCAACGGHQTVRATGFGFKCAECRESFAESVKCERCSEHWVGITDDDLSCCDCCIDTI
jgi:hypothetical protein